MFDKPKQCLISPTILVPGSKFLPGSVFEIDMRLLVSGVELICLVYITSILLVHIYDMRFDIRVKFR